ncbi:hypothetical protein DFH09DRAFT_1091747 [Mycena vulgaris]|nr:hypothetical protein DFH09DRAFT_1091747 [Mycena vulgaris]
MHSGSSKLSSGDVQTGPVVSVGVYVVARIIAPRRPSQPEQKLEDGHTHSGSSELSSGDVQTEPVVSLLSPELQPRAGLVSPNKRKTGNSGSSELSSRITAPRRPPNKQLIRLGAFLEDGNALGQLSAYTWAPVGPLTYGDQSDRREEGGDVWDIDCRKKGQGRHSETRET